MMKLGEHKNLEIVTNGYDKDSFIQDIQGDIQATSSLNGRSAEEGKPGDQGLEGTGNIAVHLPQGTGRILLCLAFFLSFSYNTVQ